uniref:Uncharacterized protein n=1 Tax=Lygus hesperus TaxID=30085 RepID=A0A0A9YG20_LYGHE
MEHLVSPAVVRTAQELHSVTDTRASGTPTGALPPLDNAGSGCGSTTMTVAVNAQDVLHVLCEMETIRGMYPEGCALQLLRTPTTLSPPCTYNCSPYLFFVLPCTRLAVNTVSDRVQTSWAPNVGHRFHLYSLNCALTLNRK